MSLFCREKPDAKVFGGTYKRLTDKTTEMLQLGLAKRKSNMFMMVDAISIFIPYGVNVKVCWLPVVSTRRQHRQL